VLLLGLISVASACPCKHDVVLKTVVENDRQPQATCSEIKFGELKLDSKYRKTDGFTFSQAAEAIWPGKPWPVHSSAPVVRPYLCPHLLH